MKDLTQLQLELCDLLERYENLQERLQTLELLLKPGEGAMYQGLNSKDWPFPGEL